MSTGMIVDGVFASQAIDSSGEILDIEGCDISTLDKDGVANYEHKEGDKKGEGNNGEEIVGKIIFAKKVFKLADADTDRERSYWEQVRVPYIYGMVRLYDGAGHAGAQALAAQIRDHAANNEPILVRYSIEGSTLERDKDNRNKLNLSVARRVAMTLKPCNRTCVSGVVEDPKAPAGFDKYPGTSARDSKDLLSDLMDKGEHSHPAYTRLGGAVDVECNPYVNDEIQTKLRLLAKAHLLKALEAGGYGGAPSSLTQGSALQREDRGLRSKLHEIVSGYKSKPFSKGEFKAYAKMQLPEADDSFLDHFADVAHDYHARRLKKAINLEGDRPVEPQEGLGWAPPEKPKKAKGPTADLTSPPAAARASAKPTTPNPHTAIPGAGGGGKNRLTLHPNGTLQTPKGEKLDLHIPSGPEYMSIMYPDSHDIPEEKKVLYKRTVHEPWERAMQSWMELNKRAREGKVPRSVVKLAGLFSAMSPNTGVPLQERHFGHLMDMMHEGVLDINKPVTEEHIKEFERRAQGPNMPNWNNEWYNSQLPPEELPEDVRARHPEGMNRFPPPGVENEEEAAARAAKPNKFGNEKAELPQIAGLRHLDDIMPHLEHLFATHKDDARSMASELMGMKSNYKRKATSLGSADKAKEALEGVHPTVHGFGPKLARYMLTMAGAGNTIVPDRHMTRSLYNLGKDDPMSEYLATRVVTQAKNEPFLGSLDQHFFHKHPAVKYVLNKYPEHFKGHEEQAIFPAFWLHWLHLPHYEANQGRETEATIGGTDHKVFWDATQDIMRHHGISVRGEHYNYTPPDTSFNFGENTQKAESGLVLHRGTASPEGLPTHSAWFTTSSKSATDYGPHVSSFRVTGQPKLLPVSDYGEALKGLGVQKPKNASRDLLTAAHRAGYDGYHYKNPSFADEEVALVEPHKHLAPHENLGKTEPPHPMAHLPLEVRAMGAMQALTQRFGETGGLIGYYTHIVPALLAAERGQRRRDPHAVIRKAQAMTIDLRKMAAELRQEKAAARPGATHYFAGNPVVAGKAQTAEGPYDLLHEDSEHYVAVPEGQKPAPHTLCKLPKAKEGTHFTVSRRPAVLVSDLE